LGKYAKHLGTNRKYLNAMIIYRNKTRKRIEKLSVRIQLIEGLFVKYVNAVERKVLGRHLSDKIVPHPRERKFISKISPTAETVCCMLKTVYWCDACDMGLSMEFF
jgi:hypothetical protein